MEAAEHPYPDIITTYFTLAFLMCTMKYQSQKYVTYILRGSNFWSFLGAWSSMLAQLQLGLCGLAFGASPWFHNVFSLVVFLCDTMWGSIFLVWRSASVGWEFYPHKGFSLVLQTSGWHTLPTYFNWCHDMRSSYRATRSMWVVSQCDPRDLLYWRSKSFSHNHQIKLLFYSIFIKKNSYL